MASNSSPEFKGRVADLFNGTPNQRQTILSLEQTYVKNAQPSEKVYKQEAFNALYNLLNGNPTLADAQVVQFIFRHHDLTPALSTTEKRKKKAEKRNPPRHRQTV